MYIADKVNISLFQQQVSTELVNNLTKHVCLTLANIIAIDYETRLKFIPESQIHISGCTKKLRKFLGQKVITDESFSTILMLFTVAITEEIFDYHDKNNILYKSEDIVIDTLINTNFNTTNLEERKIIKSTLKYLFLARNRSELMDFIQDEPDIFFTTVTNALKKHQSSKEIGLKVKSEIDEIVDIMAKHHKKVEIFKQATSKLITAICTLAVGAITVATAGAVFALMVVPASILAVEYAPKIGEKIGERILSADKFMISEEQKITSLKTNLQKNNKEFLFQQQSLKDLLNIEGKQGKNTAQQKLDPIKNQIQDILTNKKSFTNSPKNTNSQGQIKHR